MKNLLKASVLLLALGLASCDSNTANTKATSGAGGPPLETNAPATGSTMSADTMAMGSQNPASTTPNGTGTTTDPAGTMSERKDAKAK